MNPNAGVASLLIALALLLPAGAAAHEEQVLSFGEVVFRTGYEPSTCGNATVEDYETCDDGLVNAGDGCDAQCLLEPGFYCAGVPSVCVTDCGDGVAAGAEACDDGDANDGNGCSAMCAVEPGFYCAGEPSVCNTQCGDAKIAGAEQCDDGDASDGNGCSAMCTTEPGFECTGEPSVCTTTCGDGILAGGEACDDGGTANFDGCSGTCAVEPGYECSGAPSTCEVPNCEAITTPAAQGFMRATVPSSWAQLTGGTQFPDVNLTSPARVVPASVVAGVSYLGASRGQWASVAFTTSDAAFTGSLQFLASQIPGTTGNPSGDVSITRCPGDFRATVAEPQESTDYPPCRKSTGFSAVLSFNSSGVSGDGETNNICGLLPGHTYFLNYINANVSDGIAPAEHNCPNNMSACGKMLKVNN